MSEINVTEITQRILVDMPTRTVAVLTAGPVGPVGPIGEVSMAQLNAAIAVVEADQDVINQALVSDIAEKVAKDGDTMTGNLVISNNTPWLELYDANSVDANYRIRKNADFLEIMGFDDDGSTGRILLRFDTTTGAISTHNFGGAGPISLSFASSVTVPPISGPNQAAQVTAIDAATGRLAIGGKEIGDTGWRDVSSTLTAEYSASSAALHIRRSANVVYTQGDIRFADTTTKPTNDIIGLDCYPTGFQSKLVNGAHDIVAGVDKYGIAENAWLRPAWANLRTLLGSRFPNPNYAVWRFAFTYATDDPWPVTLPGTPV